MASTNFVVGEGSVREPEMQHKKRADCVPLVGLTLLSRL
jgi:hypothetical protein